MEQANKQDEISLKELILTLRSWKQYLLSKWIVIGIAGLVGAGLGIVYARKQHLQYVGELTFVLEDSKSGGLAAYSGLASQFGLDLGSGGSSGLFEGDNIMEFLKSRLMLERTLLTPVTINSKQTTLADLYIHFKELDKNWDKDTALKGLHYPVGQPRETFSLKQDSILDFIRNEIGKRNLNISKVDKKLSFIVVQVSSEDQIFSKVFTERLVAEATDFYVKTKTKRSKTNVDKLQAIADSIELLLNKKTYSTAVAQDLNVNPIRQVANVEAEIRNRDKMVLQTMYAEVVKNLEISKMTMAQETPIVQVIDTPILPLKKERFGKLKGLILGGFIGGVLILMYLILRKMLRDVMA